MRSQLQKIIEELLAETHASRTTLRLQRPGETFPVISEALAPGVSSIKDDYLIAADVQPINQFLEREKRILVQRDLLNAEPAPPAKLIDVYGAKAQMLAPLIRTGRLYGVISVHYAPGPRDWTQDDISALERAVERVGRELEQQD